MRHPMSERDAQEEKRDEKAKRTTSPPVLATEWKFQQSDSGCTAARRSRSMVETG